MWKTSTYNIQTQPRLCLKCNKSYFPTPHRIDCPCQTPNYDWRFEQ